MQTLLEKTIFENRMQQGNISSKFSCNSKAEALEIQENLWKCFLGTIYIVIYSQNGHR